MFKNPFDQVFLSFLKGYREGTMWSRLEELLEKHGPCEIKFNADPPSCEFVFKCSPTSQTKTGTGDSPSIE